MPGPNIAVRLGNFVPAGIAERLGKSEAAKRLLRPLASAVVPDDPVPVTIRSGAAAGLEIEIDLKQEKFYWTGAYEPAIQKAIVAILRPGDVFWDIGAHAGFFTLIAARSVGTAGVIHSFEPNGANRKRLASTIAINGFTNVHIHPEAISDRLGTAQFLFHSSSTMGHLVTEQEQNAPSVPTTTLDRVFETTGIAPRLIKIDAEGAETTILRGGGRILDAGNTAWLVEVHDLEHAEPVCAALKPHELRWLDHNHLLALPQNSHGISFSHSAER